DSRITGFLTQQPWAVLAALDRNGQVGTSLLQGAPGFLQVADASTLEVRAALPAADPLRESFQYENEMGMLLLDPRTRRRVRINGRAHLKGDGALVVKTREVFGNCPKYIQRREIADLRSGELREPVSTS